MHDALVRAEPPEVGVRLHLAVHLAEVRDDLVDIAADEWEGTLPGGFGDDIGSAADGEREAVAGQVCRVGFEDDVGR